MLSRQLTLLRPRAKAIAIAIAIALFFVALVIIGFIEWNGEDIEFMITISALFLADAFGLVFRWPFSRSIGVFLSAVMVAMGFWASIVNALVFAIALPMFSLPHFLGFILSVAIGYFSFVSTRWLQGSLAKEYFSRAAI